MQGESTPIPNQPRGTHSAYWVTQAHWHTSSQVTEALLSSVHFFFFFLPTQGEQSSPGVLLHSNFHPLIPRDLRGCWEKSGVLNLLPGLSTCQSMLGAPPNIGSQWASIQICEPWTCFCHCKEAVALQQTSVTQNETENPADNPNFSRLCLQSHFWSH